ncbi:probable calcium-binding protein CML36 [Diospyros lotus]|uniref:probable calcium-binding protein CML36 n=1 Tax=Diospyros lotus TaxID=55363 RepID=UPI00224E4E6B|nr:probable calcium-binding protein CML36 [Diospyros lotus]
MKLAIKINPKQIFRSKKTRYASRSDPSSFSLGSLSSDSSESSSSSSQQHHKSDLRNGTPKSVLPSSSMQISGDWSELMAGDVYSELVQAFKMIDRDGDGKITTKELEAVLNRVGTQPLSEEELGTMLSEVDRDGDGCISLEEFSAIGPAFGPPACPSELRNAFDFFDADHDGKISPAELHSVFVALGDERCTLEDCRRMISGVDKNGDGFVCFEDFARMMELQRI